MVGKHAVKVFLQRLSVCMDNIELFGSVSMYTYAPMACTNHKFPVVSFNVHLWHAQTINCQWSVSMYTYGMHKP